MSPLLEPGWTQYGLDGHLRRKAKDYLHQFVYALSLEKRSFQNWSVSASCISRRLPQKGCVTKLPTVDWRHSVLMGLQLPRELAEPGCALPLGWFGFAARVCHPPLESVRELSYILRAPAQAPEIKPNHANAFQSSPAIASPYVPVIKTILMADPRDRGRGTVNKSYPLTNVNILEVFRGLTNLQQLFPHSI